MAVESPVVRGEQRRVGVLRKSSYSTDFGSGQPIPSFSSSELIRCSDFKMKQSIPRENIPENRQTLGEAYERLSQIKTGEWSVEGILRGSGDPGDIANQWAPFLLAGLGSETQNAGTSYVYAPSDDQDDLGWLDLMVEHNEVFGKYGLNAWVDTFKINAKGKENPKFMAAGGLSDMLRTGSTVLTLQNASSDTCTIAAGHEDRFRVDSPVVIINASNGSRSNLKWIDSTASGELTLDSALSGTYPNGSTVSPYSPTENAAQSAIAGILGSITLDGTTYKILEFEVEVNNGIEPNDDEAFAEVVSDYNRSWRTITGFVKFRARRDQIEYLTQLEDFPSVAISVQLGETSGYIWTVSLPQVELEFEEMEVPNQGAGVVTLPYVAKPSDHETSDEISITLT